MCYAYLADVPSSAVDDHTIAIISDFSRSKWFKRGWTLQELIAPSIVIFLDQKWQEIDTKSNLQQKTSEITGIPVRVLLENDIESASVAQRMSWAWDRATTRTEDLAYCLMSIFDVNMPMHYGEGEKACMRLQEEIMKVSDDHSLFAWMSHDSRGGILATSPKAFRSSSTIVLSNPSGATHGVITVNNKSIYLEVRNIDENRPL